ncbi:MAG: hypothetical protein IPF52_03165 [Saprospiraceae bacterium]|nr:hypothetical protein [Saprospiraceae bacterium]
MNGEVSFYSNIDEAQFNVVAVILEDNVRGTTSDMLKSTDILVELRVLWADMKIFPTRFRPLKWFIRRLPEHCLLVFQEVQLSFREN